MKKIFVLLLAALFMTSMFSTAFVNAISDNSADIAANHLRDKFNLGDANKYVMATKTKMDNLGYRHVKFQQIANNIPVWGGDMIVHLDEAGNVYADSGEFQTAAMNFTQKGSYIGEKAAMDIAKTNVNYNAAEAPVDANVQPDSITSKMYLYNVNGEYVPVYVVRVNWFHPETFGDWRVFVNAYNGEIVNKFNAINDAKVTGTNATGTGTGVLNDTKTINLTKSGSYYYLQDNTKAMSGKIYTYNANNRTSLPGTLMSSTSTIWNTSTQKAAVDAHYYAGKVYDYYKNVLGRNSINGSGMSIKSTVHYSRNYVNAFWNGTQMVYGDGDGVQAVALSGGLDVIAHEMTHGVDEYEANLTYQDESGALNESISDIMGAVIEFYAQPSQADWLMGEDIWTPGTPGDALRSMQDPTLYDQPAHMNDYYNTTDDNGGVHTNSGIPNKAAYLIGSQIGADKLGKITYRALANYLTSSSDFSAFRSACLQATADLYGSTGTEYTVVGNAFSSVGVY